jgi:GNAT superfamily N-acetyltransferase
MSRDAGSVTKMVPFQVDRMRPQEQHASVVTLARAFHDDPLFNFLIPDLLSQARAALTFMGSLVADARAFDEVWVARAGAAIVGVAVWLPPGSYPRGTRRDAANYRRDTRSVLRLGPRMLAGMRLEAEIQRAHRRVTEQHWYLALLGADPTMQRRGVGSALLEPVLTRADQHAVAVYLETQKQENVPWYRRHGFEVADELAARGCPHMWTMRRDPS